MATNFWPRLWVVKFIVFKNIRNQESNEVFESYRQQGLADIISGLSKEMLKEDHVLNLSTTFTMLQRTISLLISMNVMLM